MEIIIIAAITIIDNVIGIDNKLPWNNLKGDMKHFKETTSGHPIIMGRKTFESFGSRCLPNRLNVVLTRDADYIEKTTCKDQSLLLCYDDIDDALWYINYQRIFKNEKCFIIGGAEIYNKFLDLGIVDKVILTFVNTSSEIPEQDGLVYFPFEKIEKDFEPINLSEIFLQDDKNEHDYQIVTYQKK